MGLDISHDAWHGAYSAFGRWREEIARLIDVPLPLMEGFYGFGLWEYPVSEAKRLHAESPYTNAVARAVVQADEWLPLKWESLRPDPLHVLLNHSDCDGEIEVADLLPIAARLEELLPRLPVEVDNGHIGNWKEKTQKFIDGCRLAASLNEPLLFR